MSDREPGNYGVLAITGDTSDFIDKLYVVRLGPGGVLSCLHKISDGVSPGDGDLLESSIEVGYRIP